MTLTIAQASKWLSSKRAEGGDRAPGVDPRTACPHAVSRTTVCVPREASRFRDAAVAECAFPSRRGAREVWGNPPARLRRTMENASTGQMRSSNPPSACGAACARVRRSRFELDLTERRTLRVGPHVKPHSGGVTLTEKYTLYAGPHGKAHSARRTSRKDAVCVAARTQSALFGETRRQSALFREAAPRLPR